MAHLQMRSPQGRSMGGSIHCWLLLILCVGFATKKWTLWVAGSSIGAGCCTGIRAVVLDGFGLGSQTVHYEME